VTYFQPHNSIATTELLMNNECNINECNGRKKNSPRNATHALLTKGR